MVIVTVVLPLPERLAGLKLHALFRGSTEHEKVTVELNPVPPAMVKVVVALCPGVTEAEAELRDGENSGETVIGRAAEAED